MKNRLILLITVVFCLIFTGCSSAGTISTYTLSLDRMPKNLDPQVATGAEELLIITNTFDGLFEYRDGEIVNNVCESYQVENNGTKYIFTLKSSSSFYVNKTEQIPVTSRDFAFALNRILDPDTHSPYYSDFAGISGISTPDDSTLVITLDKADSNFLSKLCMPCTSPCNEEFFRETKGAYGLSVKDILSNGPFTVNYLADDGSYATLIRVAQNEGDLDRIRISLNKEGLSGSELYKGDSVSGFFTDSSDSFDGTQHTFESSEFGMFFNMENPVLQNKNIRCALGWFCFGMENSGANLAAVNQSTNIYTDSLTFGGVQLNSLVTAAVPQYMSQNPKDLLTAGLGETQLSKLSGLTVLVPSDSRYSAVIENINQLWQKQLNAFLTIEYLPAGEIETRIAKGSYDIAFYSFKPQSNSPVLFSQPFAAYDSDIAACIEQINLLGGDNAALRYIQQAQNLVLENAYCVPMCTDSTSYWHRSWFENVEINPFGNIVNLKYVTVK